MKTQQKKEEALVVTRVLCEYQDRLARFIESGLKQGYVLACPPIYTGKGEPEGANGAAVGYRWEHFLVVMIKKTATA